MAEDKNYYHLFQSVFADLLYQRPSSKLTIIGVTGTGGKTTTVNLLYHTLHAAGHRVAMVSTIGAAINGDFYDTGFHTTTPSPFALKRYIKKAADTGNSFLILEVTSHAIDQYRVHNIHFAVSVITNITHEHLDYHKTYENYLRTKARMLLVSDAAVINKDDQSYQFLIEFLSQKNYDRKIITYSMNNDADVTPQNFSFSTKLFGDFNKYNSLAAIAALKQVNMSDKEIRAGLASYTPPVGRQEIIYDGEFQVMIDFAHTPNALKELLKTLRQEIKGKLIHVFGSAGERDASKRPLMGQFSSAFADIIILTAEDPRSESVEKITEEIARGIGNSKFEIRNPKQVTNLKSEIQNDRKGIYKIPDRQEAINTAIAMAEKGDMVVITGKGHEQSMNFGKGEVAWSDHEAVGKAIEFKSIKGTTSTTSITGDFHD